MSNIQLGSDLSSETEIGVFLMGDQKTGEYTYQDSKYLVSSNPLPAIDGAVLVQIPVKEAYSVRENVKWLLVRFGIIILIVMAIAIMIIIEFYLLKPLMNLSDKMHKIADGDLKVNIKTKRKDEIGDLANTFNKMVKQLKELITGIHTAAERVSTSTTDMKRTFQEVIKASEQINISMTNVSSGTEDQVNSIENVNLEIHGLADSLNQLSDTNKRVDKLTVEMNQATEKGQKDITRVRKQMDNIKSAINDVEVGINSLENSSDEIDNILELIKSISKQTNLLALNAAIEAARAG